jgi:hypothetical protein
MPPEPFIGFISLGVFLTTLLGTAGYGVLAMASRKHARRNRRR